MRLKNYITELSAKLDDFKVTKQTGRVFHTQFSVGPLNDKVYKVEIELDRYGYDFVKSDDVWDISFHRDATTPARMNFRFDKTGDMTQKQAIQVFSGVQKSVEIFFKKYKPEAFLFIGEDPDHVKLYDTLSKIVAKRSKYILNTAVKYMGKKFYIFTKTKDIEITK